MKPTATKGRKGFPRPAVLPANTPERVAQIQTRLRSIERAFRKNIGSTAQRAALETERKQLRMELWLVPGGILELGMKQDRATRSARQRSRTSRAGAC